METGRLADTVSLSDMLSTMSVSSADFVKVGGSRVTSTGNRMRATFACVCSMISTPDAVGVAVVVAVTVTWAVPSDVGMTAIVPSTTDTLAVDSLSDSAA